MEYKLLKESQVPDSYTLPKVTIKDFSDYLSNVKEVRLLPVMLTHSAFPSLP